MARQHPSATGRAQVSEGRREGAGRRREERERMVGREEGVDWGGGGEKNDPGVPQPMKRAGKFNKE